MFKYVAILGNVLFIAWIWWNGIDEGFKATPLQLVSYLSLTALLILNIYFLTRKK
jgi:hypothetical protein